MDLFSGIGGFALGLKQARIEFEEHWFSEIDKNAINIYKKHFPNAKELGDVRAIRDFSGIKADIITFGFPCQDLSVAGKRRGLDGERSGLFFEAIRCIRELRPDVFIFENVKGLLTNNGGADYVRCLREIADIGLYECEWQLVNTSWVLPQNRERIYFVGYIGGKSRSQIFPIEKQGKQNTQRNNGEVKQLLNIVNSGNWENPQRGRIYSVEGICPALNCCGGGGLEPKIVVPVLTPTREEKRQNGRRFKNNGDPSFTLTTQDQHGIFNGVDIRKLTPLECERLQGFPDGWTEYGADGKKISDSARYKALGNAVTVNFPRMIGEKLR